MTEPSAREREIRERLDAYVAGKDFIYNPDSAVVDRVIHGLAMREEKTGHAYCPCRLVTGDEEKDKGIVCPCVHHEKEIAEQGYCHCHLFVAKEAADA